MVGGRPFWANVARMDSRGAQPIMTINVPPVRAKASQETEDSSFEGSSLPLTTVKLEAIPRCVTGIPA